MEREMDAKDRGYIDNNFTSLVLLIVCLSFLSLGIFLYHFHIFPTTESSVSQLERFMSLGEREYTSLLLFLTDVIVAARLDITCFLWIAFSRLTRIPRLFAIGVLSYRSAVFGFCGSFIIVNLACFPTRLSGVFAWLIFFIYHIAYFSLLLCFCEMTLHSCGKRFVLWEAVQYAASILLECSLIIFLKWIYCFLINKINS